MKSKKSYKHGYGKYEKYERKKRSKSKIKRSKIIKTLKKQKRGGFKDDKSLAIFINYLRSQNENECCIFDKLEMFDDSNSVSKNNESIDACVKKVFECEKDVILIPYMIPGHANLIIIRDNLVEWFEPHGDSYEDETIQTLSESFLELFIEKLNKKAIENFEPINQINENLKPQKRTFRLETPEILCPYDGPQKSDKYCMTWSLYVLAQIVKNPREDTKTIIDEILDIKYSKRREIIENFEDNYNDYVKQRQQLNYHSMKEIFAKENKYKSNVNFMKTKHNAQNYKVTTVTHAF